MGTSSLHTSILPCTRGHEDENRVSMCVHPCNSFDPPAVCVPLFLLNSNLVQVHCLVD